MTNLNQQSNDLDQNEKKETLKEVSDEEIKEELIDYAKKYDKGEEWINFEFDAMMYLKERAKTFFYRDKNGKISMKGFSLDGHKIDDKSLEGILWSSYTSGNLYNRTIDDYSQKEWGFDDNNKQINDFKVKLLHDDNESKVKIEPVTSNEEQQDSINVSNPYNPGMNVKFSRDNEK